MVMLKTVECGDGSVRTYHKVIGTDTRFLSEKEVKVHIAMYIDKASRDADENAYVREVVRLPLVDSEAAEQLPGAVDLNEERHIRKIIYPGCMATGTFEGATSDE